MPNEPWAELGDTISAVRAQLQQAMDDGQDQQLKFRTGPVELEFTVEVKKEGSAGTKVFVLPWTVDARGSAASDRTHTIRITLQPVDGQGGDAKIAAAAEQRPG